MKEKSKMWPLFTDKLISDKDGRESCQPYQLGTHSKLGLSKKINKYLEETHYDSTSRVLASEGGIQLRYNQRNWSTSTARILTSCRECVCVCVCVERERETERELESHIFLTATTIGDEILSFTVR